MTRVTLAECQGDGRRPGGVATQLKGRPHANTAEGGSSTVSLQWESDRAEGLTLAHFLKQECALASPFLMASSIVSMKR